MPKYSNSRSRTRRAKGIFAAYKRETAADADADAAVQQILQARAVRWARNLHLRRYSSQENEYGGWCYGRPIASLYLPPPSLFISFLPLQLYLPHGAIKASFLNNPTFSHAKWDSPGDNSWERLVPVSRCIDNWKVRNETFAPRDGLINVARGVNLTIAIVPRADVSI